MNYFHPISESLSESTQLEPTVQAALFILNGVSPGKDHLSRIASCFECSSVPKSTFIAEEGLMVRFSLLFIAIDLASKFSIFFYQASHVFVIFGEHSTYKANPSFDTSLCNKAKTLRIPERNQSSAVSGYGGFLHVANELSVSSFGFEGYFVSNFYPVSVVSQESCVVAKADCLMLLSSIQNVDFIDTLRKAALLRTNWLAMRSQQAVQVLGSAKPSQDTGNYFQKIRMQSWLGSQVYPKGPYRKALMNKDDYNAISLRWREAREELQKKRLQNFLSIEKPSPQVACLYASSVQSTIVRLKTAQKPQSRLDATQIHGLCQTNDTKCFRELRSKPWIAEATAIMKVRKSMNPSISAQDMLQTSTCSRIAAQGFSKVTITFMTAIAC